MTQETNKKFIVFEYVDGGKIDYFVDKIKEEGVLKEGEFVQEREPTYGIFGGALMPILRGDLKYSPHFLELTFGFLADRANHTLRGKSQSASADQKDGRTQKSDANEEKREQGIQELSITGLLKHKHVICDRYNLSTYAYQIAGLDPKELPNYDNETPDDMFRWFEDVCKYFPRPDLTIFLNFDFDTLVDNLGKLNPTTPPFSILSRKDENATEAEDRDKKKEILKSATENYNKAIDYLTKKAKVLQRIEKIDVEYDERAWRRVKLLLTECLKS